MIRIEGDRFKRVERPTGVGRLLSLAEAGMLEGEHLRDYIVRSPEVFFAECGLDLLIIGTEVFLASRRLRADILAIDRDGVVVVIELKRNSHRDQHLQALNYAAYLWSPEGLQEGVGAVFQLLQSEVVQTQLASFLRAPIGNVNRKQRIVLIAEDFFLTTVRTALYLTKKCAFDVALYRIALHEYSDGRYLGCEQVAPENELMAAQAVSLPPRESSTELQIPAETVPTWDSPHLASFVEAHLAVTRTTKVGLVFFLRANSYGVRFALDRRKGSAGRVLQSQRFPGDVEFWRKYLPNVNLREKERKKGEGRNPLQWNLKDQASLASFLHGLQELPQDTAADTQTGDCR